MTALLRRKLLAAVLLWAALPSPAWRGGPWVSEAAAEPTAGRATALSVVSTLAPAAIATEMFVADQPEAGWTVLLAGLEVGPSAGFFYGGMPGRAFAGIGTRVAFSAVAVLGVGVALDESSDAGNSGLGLLLLGTAGVATSIVYDVAVVGRRVEERHPRTVGVVPWRSAEGVPGLAVSVKF